MEVHGKWTKDEEGYMTFEPQELQRQYETIVDRYYQVYNRYVDEFDDDEEAYEQTLQAGYEMTTDYKTINGREEFTTTFITPGHVLDMWYETDEYTEKRDYMRGFVRIATRQV